jgi:hypothetical protein
VDERRQWQDHSTHASGVAAVTARAAVWGSGTRGEGGSRPLTSRVMAQGTRAWVSSPRLEMLQLFLTWATLEARGISPPWT